MPASVFPWKRRAWPADLGSKCFERQRAWGDGVGVAGVAVEPQVLVLGTCRNPQLAGAHRGGPAAHAPERAVAAKGAETTFPGRCSDLLAAAWVERDVSLDGVRQHNPGHDSLAVVATQRCVFSSLPTNVRDA